MQTLGGKSEESIGVERRGALVWKWFRPRPATCYTEWLAVGGWLAQVRRRIAASRSIVLPGAARMNPVVWFDAAAWRWATPWIDGPHASAEQIIALRAAIDRAGLAFIMDVNAKNVLVDRRFGGLVVIDFQLYDAGFDNWASHA